VLLGVARGDTTADAERLARKVANLRIFENDEGKFDRSLLDTGGAALVVSNFTLVADTAKGSRPSFSEAAPSDEAEPLYEAFCAGSGQRSRPASSARVWRSSWSTTDR
jgi:D-tyrosyl-tRNA(Tyr) deacylase